MMYLPESLQHIVIDESYILDIEAKPGVLVLKVDFALMPGHARYMAPQPGNQYCYTRGQVLFERVKWITWDNQGAPPAVDASNEIDYGTIDRLEFLLNEQAWAIEGDWGRIRVGADDPVALYQR